MTTNSEMEAADLEALLAQVDGQHRRLLEAALTGFVDVASVANELQVSQQYVRKLIATGHLSAVKMFDALLIERASVERYKPTRRPAGRPKKNQP